MKKFLVMRADSGKDRRVIWAKNERSAKWKLGRKRDDYLVQEVKEAIK